MSKKVKIGIIGSGGIAGAHARAYKQMEHVEIVAVSDVLPGKAKKFLETFELTEAKAFEDHRHMLELEMDGVSVCTPNQYHHTTSIDSLLAGKHVLVEKPMSVTLEQAVLMAKAAKQTGNILTIGFQPRYDPNMKKIKEIVQSGQLGDVYYVEMGGGRRRGIPGPTFINKESAGSGAIADIGCYSLDMALNAMGYPKPVTVSSYTSSFFGTNPKYFANASRFEVEDFGVALIRFESGQVLNFKISWAMHMDTLGPALFLGTEAGLKVTPAGTGPRGGVWDGGVGSITLLHDVAGFHCENDLPVQAHNLNLFHEKVKDFVEAIVNGKPAPIPSEQILINQAIIDGILRSSESKREVDIEIPVI